MRSRGANATAAAAGLGVFAISALIVRNGKVSAPERAVFHAVNDLPGWLYRAMFVFQQSGNLVIAVIVVVAAGAVLRNWRLAAAGLSALVLKLALERAVKSVIERSRPGTSTGDAILRGSVSAHGLSFVSGHAIITAALAMLFMPLLPPKWRFAPWVVVALNAVARIYVGAHNPLDIVGGIGLGVFIGGLANLVFAPTRPAPAPAVTGPEPLAAT